MRDEGVFETQIIPKVIAPNIFWNPPPKTKKNSELPQPKKLSKTQESPPKTKKARKPKIPRKICFSTKIYGGGGSYSKLEHKNNYTIYFTNVDFSNVNKVMHLSIFCTADIQQTFLKYGGFSRAETIHDSFEAVNQRDSWFLGEKERIDAFSKGIDFFWRIAILKFFCEIMHISFDNIQKYL